MKHDEARILRLPADPGAMSNWTAALRDKIRAQLDTDAAGAGTVLLRSLMSTTISILTHALF
eukprot:scaffold135_cov161-Ochromonas_danica.AAC.4